MRKVCRWVNILIAVAVGVLVAALGLIGALNDLNIVYFAILSLAVLSLALAICYALRKDCLRIDLKCLVITAFIAIVASVIGIIVDILTLFELPILIVAVAAVTLALIAAFKLLRIITRRGGY